MLIEIGEMVPHTIRGRFWPGALAAAALATASACSSSSSSTATAPAATVCPSSYAAASGAACNVASESCPYIMPCGAFEALVTCVCTGGTLVCGASSLSADGSPGPICPPATPASACPTTEALASVSACSDIGQQCAYPGAFSSIPAYDVCVCAPGPTATAGPQFECTPSMGLPDASAPATDAGADASVGDANIPDAVVDAPSDGATPSLDGATEQ
jgi:hypothetical protein